MALAGGEIRKIAVELDQTGIAVLAVGSTTRQKLSQMARLAEKVADGLHGQRPEIMNARFELDGAIRAVRSAPVQGQIPGQKLRDLARVVDQLRRPSLSRYLEAEVRLEVDGFDVHNAWGYSKHEAREATQALTRAARELKRVGLEKVASLQVELDPKRNVRSFAYYEPLSDVLVLNLSKGSSNNVRDVLRALAGRVWVDLGQGDYETWGGPSKSGRFERAFADLLVDGPGKVDLDALARLETTVGRQASRWPTSPA